MSSYIDAIFERQPAADAVAFRLQKGFRALLDAMARPGELASLDALAPDAEYESSQTGLLRQTISLGDILLDGQTSLAVAGPNGDAIAHALSRRTHVHIRGMEEASFCIIPGNLESEEVRRAVLALTPGTLESPHLSATCIIECSTLIGQDRNGVRSGSTSGIEAPSVWELSGPGVDGTVRIACDCACALKAREERHDEFPCGIDIVFVDGAGHLACIPRSTHVVALGTMGEVDVWAM